MSFTIFCYFFILQEISMQVIIHDDRDVARQLKKLFRNGMIQVLTDLTL